MSVTLDPATEQRFQRVLEAGLYRDPSDLVAHALDLVEAERQGLTDRRAHLLARLDESLAQGERGETFSPEEVRARLAQQRQAHEHAFATR